MKVVHYLNQFFAGLGGEDKADLGPGSRNGAAGPGLALNQALGLDGEVVGTVYCGDSYFGERPDRALGEVLELIRSFDADIVIAGPAFGSGRYGLACAQVCKGVKESLSLPAVTGMHPDNPAVELYRWDVLMAATRETAVGMGEAVPVMVSLARKMAADESLGPAAVEGYIPTGRRRNEFLEKTAADRGVDMLLRKLRGEDPETEWLLPRYDRVEPARPLEDPGAATIALATEGGIVPRGNPERLESGWATKWLKLDVAESPGLSGEQYQSIHGGFDTTAASADPNRMVPLDAARDLEEGGEIGKVHEYLYSTTGNVGAIADIKRFGQEIAAELTAAGVQGVILTAT